MRACAIEDSEGVVSDGCWTGLPYMSVLSGTGVDLRRRCVVLIGTGILAPGNIRLIVHLNNNYL